MQMNMDLLTYHDKVKACFLGKNIGGTLGAPFECYRGVFDIDFYTQDLKGKPAPNDDLDLQLVWLNAVERYSNRVNAQILAEYWLSYITPSWAEYGACKNNLRTGLCPPFSGYVNNLNRDSCGAFIRSELWACLAPGHPQIAARYAYEDASVDHSHEGVYAAVFTAAMQSAAFSETDRERLIEIGLSYIPQDSGVARAVKMVAEHHQKGIDWKQTREDLLVTFPSTFGLLSGTYTPEQGKALKKARIGYDAPCNVGITILGWYYGEGDFGKSLCLAAGCGEDADCTAATLGALLGIIGGTQSIDAKWVEPIGNHIETLSINLADHDCDIPKTIDVLAERIIRQTPLFLGAELCDTVHSEKGYTIHLLSGEALSNCDKKKGAFDVENFQEVLDRQPFTLTVENTLFEAVLDFHEPPYLTAGGQKKFTLRLKNRFLSQQFIRLKWFLPDGFAVSPSADMSISLEQYHGNIGRAQTEWTISVPECLIRPQYELILELAVNGRHTRAFIPVTLLNMTAPESDLIQ